ncbi:MAG: hypothetical protein HY907_00170 [Deltaproteobacteria bacterium]|nr:hypothetical protein [Deltaproteobacteria bacterium]
MMRLHREGLGLATLGAAALAAACSVEDEDKTALEPPAVTDADEGQADLVSLLTDVIGEFRYYGETVEGEFLRRGFVGFTFQAKAGETVTLEVEALTDRRDTVIWLYPPLDPTDPAGEIWREPIAGNDDIDWPENTNSAIVDFPLTRDGRYLLVVAEYRGRTGRFRATLRCTAGGCADTPRFCGGIAAFPCPDGQWCRLDGDYPDAGGRCHDVWSCNSAADCAAQQGMGLLPTDLPCPGGSWAHYGCLANRCSPQCEPLEPETRCGRLGGYCTMFLTECESGFVGANEPGQLLGCEGGRSAKCCVPADPNPYACGTSADCVRVNADCCGCSMGGSSVAVNRAFAATATPDPATCEGTACAAVYRCTGAPACVDGLCGLVDADSPAASCAAAGGTVRTGACCLSAGDFPNTCRIGPCGCSPANSHDIQVCDCGEGRCFDGTTCVAG